MMKIFMSVIVSLMLLSVACQTSSENKEEKLDDILKMMTESNTWPLDTTCTFENKRPTGDYDHLCNIGDGFVFTTDDNIFWGLMLYEISKTSDGISYDFIIQPEGYGSIPDWNTFKSHRFFGTAIPNGITKTRQVGFNLHAFLEADFKKIHPKFKLIGNARLSAFENRSGGQSVPESLEELVGFYKTAQKDLVEKTGNGFLDGPADTVFSYTVLKIATSENDKKKPFFDWILSKKTAHPIALKLMPENYWWDPAYDFAPFGNDDGSDALYGFQAWRITHSTAEPSTYFNALAESWGTSFQQKDWTDYEQIRKERLQNIQYSGIDYAIIGVAFGQLVLEGKISPGLKEYGIKAIGRQKLLTEKGDLDYTPDLKKERLKTLNIQLSVLKRAGI